MVGQFTSHDLLEIFFQLVSTKRWREHILKVSLSYSQLGSWSIGNWACIHEEFFLNSDFLYFK